MLLPGGNIGDDRYGSAVKRGQLTDILCNMLFQGLTIISMQYFPG